MDMIDTDQYKTTTKQSARLLLLEPLCIDVAQLNYEKHRNDMPVPYSVQTRRPSH